MFKKLGRYLKYKYLSLLRKKGASTVIARSFAIGMFIEFITLPTMGLAFLLLYPLIKLFRGLFSVALIGFAIGKLLLPFFLVLNYKVGAILINSDVPQVVTEGVHNFFSLAALKEKGLVFLTGSGLNGLIMAFLCYGLVYWALAAYRKRKELRRCQRSFSTTE